MEYLYLCIDELAGNGAGELIVKKLSQPNSEMRNKSRKLLEGKCVRIESPEHSEFIIKLAEDAGFMQYEGDFTGNYKNGDFLFFYGDNDITCAHGNTKGWEEITIPLPPKEEPEPKEWPQVGDTVTWGTCEETAEVLAIHECVAWVLKDSGNYSEVAVRKLKKPKTEAEILRGCVWDTVSEYIEKESIIDAVTTDLINNYNITKKPQ